MLKEQRTRRSYQKPTFSSAGYLTNVTGGLPPVSVPPTNT